MRRPVVQFLPYAVCEGYKSYSRGCAHVGTRTVLHDKRVNQYKTSDPCFEGDSGVFPGDEASSNGRDMESLIRDPGDLHLVVLPPVVLAEWTASVLFSGD